jgi:hypothetical protein
VIAAIKKAEVDKSTKQKEALTNAEEKATPAVAINNILPPPVAAPETKSIIYYEVCSPQVFLTTSADDFLHYHNREKIHRQIKSVLEMEAPISKDLLCKRVLTAWGISRMGTRVAAHLESICAELGMHKTVHDKGIFFWKNGQEPSGYAIYRIARQETQKRDADYLPPEEVANAIKEILSNQLSLSKADLVRETARLFGYARIGTNVENAVTLGLTVACRHGYAVIENDRVAYKGQ